MQKSNQNKSHIKFLITHSRVLGWLPVIATVVLSIVFIMVYDYLPSYSKWFVIVGIIAAIVKIITAIFISLGDRDR